MHTVASVIENRNEEFKQLLLNFPEFVSKMGAGQTKFAADEAINTFETAVTLACVTKENLDKFAADLQMAAHLAAHFALLSHRNANGNSIMLNVMSAMISEHALRLVYLSMAAYNEMTAPKDVNDQDIEATVATALDSGFEALSAAVRAIAATIRDSVSDD